jgi:hypothetical protein
MGHSPRTNVQQLREGVGLKLSDRAKYLRGYLLKANGSLKRMIARFAFPKMPH